MSKCISVELSNGISLSVNVDDGTKELPPEDIDALEDWVKSLRERHLKNLLVEAEQQRHNKS